MSCPAILEKNINRLNDLFVLLDLSPSEQKNIMEIAEKFPISIPAYYLSLINKEDKNDPIRKMAIPSEFEKDLEGTFDTSGEGDNTVITGMQHKYNETVMILSTNQCAMYCRHCFRKRLVGLSDEEIAKHFEEMAQYIKEHKEISNVLISGGDSLVNSNTKIEYLLKLFTSIDNLDFIRFGTRIPVVMPQRISEDLQLLEILKKYSKKKQIYIVTQFNHPNEVTEESKKAIKMLQKIGIVVKNQTVLLKGVNDDSHVLGSLLKKLTSIGVVPYYIFQCRPVKGVKGQFQVPFERGYEIIEGAKAMQNGQGKCFKYCFSCESGKIEVVGKLGDEMIFKFHEAKYEKDYGRMVYGNFPSSLGRYFVCLECRYRLVLKSVDRNQRHFFCSRKLVWRYIYNCVDKYKIGVFGYSTIFQGFVDCNKITVY